MVDPRGRADVVIEMRDFEAPLVVRWGGLLTRPRGTGG